MSRHQKRNVSFWGGSSGAFAAITAIPAGNSVLSSLQLWLYHNSNRGLPRNFRNRGCFDNCPRELYNNINDYCPQFLWNWGQAKYRSSRPHSLPSMALCSSLMNFDLADSIFELGRIDGIFCTKFVVTSCIFQALLVPSTVPIAVERQLRQQGDCIGGRSSHD